MAGAFEQTTILETKTTNLSPERGEILAAVALQPTTHPFIDPVESTESGLDEPTTAELELALIGALPPNGRC